MMKVLLVDDHQIFGQALELLVTSIEMVDKVFYVSNGHEAIKEVNQNNYDVVLLDLSLKNETGYEIFERLITAAPSIRVIALTSHGDDWSVKRALDTGFHGYLLKTDNRAEIEAALLSMKDKEVYLSTQINQKKILEINQMVHLTERELSILKAICDGYSTKLIAERLFISVKTVESHRASLHQKLEVKNINELIKKAYSLNLIPLTE